MPVELVTPLGLAAPAPPPAPSTAPARRAPGRVRWAGAALTALACAGAADAAGPYASGRLYAEVQAGGANVRVSELQFYPLLGGVSVGAYVRPGIGLELHADAGIDFDTDGGFELQLEGAAGASVRLESPPTGGTSGYVTLGYVAYTISQELETAVDGDDRRIEEDFTGVRASIGIVQRLRRVPALSVSTEFRTWYTEDGLHLTSLLLGLRLSAP